MNLIFLKFCRYLLLPSPTQFKFSITKLPKVEYFCTEVNIPSLQISNATQVTSLRDIPLPGTKLDFGDLRLTYMVDEKFENFEILSMITWGLWALKRSPNDSGGHRALNMAIKHSIDKKL